MNKQRTSEAIDWFMRLAESDVSEQELSQWIQWCTHRENLEEFQKVRTTWRGFGQIGPAATELLEAAAAGHAPVTATPVLPAKRGTARKLIALAAAAVALIAVSTIVLLTVSSGVSERGEIVAHETIETRPLPDGSILTLAPRTSIELDFTGIERALIFERGEAHFKVQPDKIKPFVVQTAGVKVVAVGTAFDVRSEAQRVTVTVQEGIVEVTAPGAEPLRLAAGERAVIDPQGQVATTEKIDVTRAAGWHEGRLEYFAAPLSTVVNDISRYSSTVIEIGDPQLENLSYTGSVFTHAIDDWLAAVEASFPVRVLTTRDEQVVLFPRQREPQSAAR